MSTTPVTARSVTKTVTIARPAAEVYAFLADPANWPVWAVVNVKAVEPTDDPEWWLMATPHGPARLRIRGDAETGLLDHDYVEEMAAWSVPARVVPNAEGSEFMITFFQPPSFSDAFFDEQTALVDIELATLKQVLEAGPAG
ncbi:polyketide cyclase [Kitasatospora atroaurantiaca]|uniref:Polyketide cyclase/dehydrase/lipid transport protein n=1 Tax=Kitasatospora atroaurantiaca TaxID=285545 RepID=A0A561EIH0_9ACTN|nr:SRPBCC family protein [Kitasatospora atroaurantiaca]TWE15411.1 polyketide cyclase/dehydrase/lipid transport protein [Kitasatospora atroaurantiaca]